MRGERGCLKLVVQGQGGGKILDADGHGGWGFLKIRQFRWTSYVYRPLIYPVRYSMLTLDTPDFFSMSRVLETGIKEQQKYEKRKQTYVDNTLNDLHHKSLKIVKKRKIPFLIKQDISFFFLTKIHILILGKVLF